mgnify:CR=1 FL=1
MSKHYNLTMTDNNGKAVTTTNVSTEHPEELMRMLTLAGKTVEITPMDSGCGCGEGPCGCSDDVEALNAEAEYRATAANDELDLDDFEDDEWGVDYDEDEFYIDEDELLSFINEYYLVEGNLPGEEYL